MNDLYDRSSEIGKEIIELKKVMLADQIINTPIHQEILDKSILLIGPMGTGKTTISKKLHEETNMPIISLDNKEQLQTFYQNKDNFDHFKEFEFYLTSSALTSMREPGIIDFGAGHSIYENPIMFYKMHELIKQFKNVVLILPCENINESLRIINERVNSRENNVPKSVFDTNKYFLESSCNYTLATDIIYTQNMTPEEIINTILNKLASKITQQNR